MYGYFAFELLRPTRADRHLVLFCATAQPSIDDVISVIRARGESNLSPDRIHLLGFQSEQEALLRIVADRRLKDLVPGYTRAVSPPAVTSSIIPRAGLAADAEVGELRWEAVACAGLKAIFTSRKGLLVSPPTHHFEKPSKRHCDRFIRGANALVDGAEVMFIAANCLRYLPGSVKHFYCDTGGIGALAFAVDSLLRRFDHDLIAGSVNTFGSYEGLKTFEFREPESSVVLISASTSGGLEKEVRTAEPRFPPSRVITLFSVGPRPSDSVTLLDLEAAAVDGTRVDQFASFPDSNCPLCRRGSIAVPMMGDQFIPGRSETEPVLINAGHAPRWLKRFLELAGGRMLLKAYYQSPNSIHAANDVFVDLQAEFESWASSSPLICRVERLCDQIVPAAARRIIHLDDAASHRLGERIVGRLGTSGETLGGISLVPADMLGQQGPLKSGATLVVAAAVASGQSLLSVSQALRNLQPNGAITYLVALARMADGESFKTLESDIRMGDIPSDFGLHVAERIHLPVVARNVLSSWAEELALLQDLANPAQGDVQTILEQRIEVLRQAQGDTVRGLADRLFWPSVCGEELSVRQGFVFFPPKLREGGASQGDVYFSVASVLHHMRAGAGTHTPLRQTEHRRRVISPLCFDRFNDGAIQASLLRAAVRPELDYSASGDESHRMASLIHSVLAAEKTPKGEAAREFLLALALERLRLAPQDLRRLHETFKDENDPVSRLLWGRIRESCP